MAEKVEAKEECFIVGVIGKAGSEQRIHADWFFDGIVKPTFDEHFQGFSVLRADTMKTPGTITTQIIDRLLNAKLVIADLTYLNPNAFYEIGIRHMAGLPIIHVHQTGEAIPFDISTFRSMEYSRSEYSHMMNARAHLRTLIESVLKPDHRVDNPVTQARGRAKFEETATPADQILEGQVMALSERLQYMERALKRLSPMERHRLYGGDRGADALISSGLAPTTRGGSTYAFSTMDAEGEANLSEFVKRFVSPALGPDAELMQLNHDLWRLSTYDAVADDVFERWRQMGRKHKIVVHKVDTIQPR